MIRQWQMLPKFAWQVLDAVTAAVCIDIPSDLIPRRSTAFACNRLIALRNDCVTAVGRNLPAAWLKLAVVTVSL